MTDYRIKQLGESEYVVQEYVPPGFLARAFGSNGTWVGVCHYVGHHSGIGLSPGDVGWHVSIYTSLASAQERVKEEREKDEKKKRAKEFKPRIIPADDDGRTCA